MSRMQRKLRQKAIHQRKQRYPELQRNRRLPIFLSQTRIPRNRKTVAIAMMAETSNSFIFKYSLIDRSLVPRRDAVWKSPDIPFKDRKSVVSRIL